jgi:hypothetical protein
MSSYSTNILLIIECIYTIFKTPSVRLIDVDVLIYYSLHISLSTRPSSECICLSTCWNMLTETCEE